VSLTFGRLGWQAGFDTAVERHDMQQAGDYSVEGGVESDLSYIRRMPLDEVLRGTDRALDHALTREVDKLGEPGENYAAHGTTPTP
jgi:hypothetical protein